MTGDKFNLYGNDYYESNSDKWLYFDIENGLSITNNGILKEKIKVYRWSEIYQIE